MKIEKIFLLILVCLVYLTAFSNTRAEEYIEIRGTTSHQGERLTVPVFARLDSILSAINVQSLDIFFTYNPNRLKFDSALGGIANSSILECSDPKVVKDTILDSVTAFLHIRCEEIASTPDSVLLLLRFTTLAGRDTTVAISPDSLHINGKIFSQINFRRGIIRFLFEPPLVQTFPELLGQNYPNPFPDPSVEGTIFPFSITRTTNVSFKIYNVLGIEVYSKEMKDVGQGFYKLQLTPIPYEWANGSYYIVMKTDEGVYQQNFLFMK